MLRMPARMVGSVRMPVRALSMTHAVARSDKFRAERDTFGDLQVPADKYWGAQTQRYVSCFLTQFVAKLPHRR